MPILQWIGKDKIINHDKELPYRVLKANKNRSVGSGNVLIQGDNLEALKSMMPYYYKQVDLIYIDPPYNTGSEKWIYNDRVNAPQIRNWFDKVVGQEGEDLTRHDKWLCMMYPRLKLLKDLLKDDGLLAISIDDNELANLKFLLDELFDRNTKVIAVKMSEASGLKMGAIKKAGSIPKYKEYVVLAKRGGVRDLYFEPINKEEWDSEYNRYLDNFEKADRTVLDDVASKPVITEDDLVEVDKILKKTTDISVAAKLKELNLSSTDQESWKMENAWRIFRTAASSSVKSLADVKRTKIDQEIFSILSKRDNLLYVAKGNYNPSSKSPRVQILFADLNLTVHPGDFWSDIKTTGLEAEGDVEFKNGKKPLALLERIIKAVPNKSALILDSFAGSGTTGHAVLNVNKHDGGQRKYILVELEEHIAQDVTAKRLKNATPTAQQATQGFTYLDLNGELFDSSGVINPKAQYEDLAAYIFYTETRQYVDLGAIKHPFIGKVGATSYYLLFKGSKGNVLDEAVFAKLKAVAGTKVVYADKSLIDEEQLAAESVIFKQVPYELKKF